MKKLLIIAGIVTLVAIPVFSVARQALLLKKYCFNMGEYRILNISGNDVKLEVDLEVKNPSDLHIELTGYDLKAYLNGTEVTTIRQQHKQALLPRQFSTVSIPIQFNPEKLAVKNNLILLSDLLTDFKNVKVRLEGTISVSVDGISFTKKNISVESKLKDMLPAKDHPSAPCV